MNELTPVVTVFLTKSGKVMVAKRSQRVGTYRGAWAGVAGFVERLPLDQAYVEMQEEAGLSRADVTLRGIGLPFTVQDDMLKRTWLVYPFLFEPDDISTIVPDWEADEIRWIDPDGLSSLTTVPGLDRALQAIWPPFGDEELWASLASIAADTVHGATYLALAGLDALNTYRARCSDAQLERAVRALAACRPSMGAFPHLAARIAAGQPIDSLKQELKDATAASAAHTAEALRPYKNILTLSYSSAVKDALVLRHKMSIDPLSVIVMESRPECEGVTLARELAAAGIRVSVITDAQCGLFIKMADAVLVGCDAITDDDQLQNKAGTSILAAMAARFRKPCFAVTQTHKILPPGFPHVLEEQEPDKLGNDQGIRFRNIIFDLTLLSSFEAVYTENGVLTSEELSKIRSNLDAAGIF